jgi:hypothetical protein
MRLVRGHVERLDAQREVHRVEIFERPRQREQMCEKETRRECDEQDPQR